MGQPHTGLSSSFTSMWVQHWITATVSSYSIAQVNNPGTIQSTTVWPGKLKVYSVSSALTRVTQLEWVCLQFCGVEIRMIISYLNFKKTKRPRGTHLYHVLWCPCIFRRSTLTKPWPWHWFCSENVMIWLILTTLHTVRVIFQVNIETSCWLETGKSRHSSFIFIFTTCANEATLINKA